LVTDLEDVAEAFGGDERDLGAFAFQQRVGGAGGSKAHIDFTDGIGELEAHEKTDGDDGGFLVAREFISCANRWRRGQRQVQTNSPRCRVECGDA
jgi:hypothetical protein